MSYSSARDRINVFWAPQVGRPTPRRLNFLIWILLLQDRWICRSHKLYVMKVAWHGLSKEMTKTWEQVLNAEFLLGESCTKNLCVLYPCGEIKSLQLDKVFAVSKVHVIEYSPCWSGKCKPGCQIVLVDSEFKGSGKSLDSLDRCSCVAKYQ